MVDPDCRPTAQEIEELIDLVRRDPSSPAFIDLGEAYLALGRPRDAVQVGNLGLEANPSNLEGRVMLARAHSAMHQWKEAQGELLRVVKVDRSSRQGFALLGEVLLRRSDFERAVPVLQHAQNLDPTSPTILAMLRRARAGQPLDPPPPMPTPVAPRGETNAPVEIQRSPRAMAAMPQPPRPQPLVPAAAPMVPTMALDASGGGMAAPAPAAPQYSGLDALTGGMPPPAAPPVPRAPKQTAPPPMSVEGIKPRIIANAKPQNAAAASLRQSAAVGENYLNDLLTGGLLDVAGVRVPDAEYDLKPDRRWGRSTRRAFIFLFVVLVLGIGGGSTWYWWSQKQKAEAIARLQEEAKTAIKDGNYSTLTDGYAKLVKAMERDQSDTLTLSYLTETCGLGTLLYGTLATEPDKETGKGVSCRPDDAKFFYDRVQKLGEPKDGEPGVHELAIGKVAIDLSRLPFDLTMKPDEKDTDYRTRIQGYTRDVDAIRKKLDEMLQQDKTDRWAMWLKGRTAMYEGKRREAMSLYKDAAAGTDGLVLAAIDYGNLLADDGKTDEALAQFKKALDATKGEHPLALVGQAIAKIEASIDINETIGDLNAKFVVERLPPRLAAWHALALAIANLTIEEYPTAIEELTKATLDQRSPTEMDRNDPELRPNVPRFWARVAWVHYKLGRPDHKDSKTGKPVLADLVETDTIYNYKARYLSGNPEPDPVKQIVEAGLALAKGQPEKVLDLAAKVDSVRAHVLRTYALLDLHKDQEAYDEATDILKTATNASGKPCEEDNDQANIEVKILCEQARMLANEKERSAAADALLSLARQAKSKLGRHALGVAYLQLGDLPNAKEHLGQAVKEITETSPNPLEYRTRTALAEVAMRENDVETAQQEIKQALHVFGSYLPAKVLAAQILLRNKQVSDVEAILKTDLKDVGTPQVQLIRAEVLVRKAKSTSADKDQAEKLLSTLKGKPGIRDEDIGRVAAMIDSKLPEKLGVPAPAASDDAGDGESGGDAPKPKKPKKRRHHR